MNIRRLRMISWTLAFANLALWFGKPLIRDGFDGWMGRLDAPLRPNAFIGIQELIVYFDLWLSRIGFPFVYTLGFVTIAYLLKPSDDPMPSGRFSAESIILAFLLLLEGTWLYLLAIEVLCRGPNWNFYGPFEAWDPHKIVLIDHVNLSDYYWHYLGGGRQFEHQTWIVREMPSFVVVAGYFLVGLLIAYRAFRRGGRHMPYWRWVLLVWLAQIAALIPLKVMLRGVFNLKYVIFLPEFFINL